jgi:hypothetical protein
LAAAGETVTEAALHETAPATLTIREAEKPNVVFLDGTAIEGGMSKNRNNYTRAALESFAAAFANKPIRINHPSHSEDSDRPEGDVWTQVGKLPDMDGFKITTLPNGKEAVTFTGAILSASPPDIWISDRIRAGIIGDMSINAGGEGVREGDGSFRVTRFTTATSLDLVTTGAAGGRAALQESIREVEDMTPDELRKLVAAQVAEALGQINIVDRVMEAQGVPKEFKALIEAEAKRLQGADAPPAAPETPPAQEAPGDLPEILGGLPAELQTLWGDSFQTCMAGEGAEEVACGHQAWLTVCQSLIPPAPAEEEATCAPKMEAALTAYVKQVKAALGKLPGAGNVTGMGAGAPPAATGTPTGKTAEERAREAFLHIPGFTEVMAATAARGR